MSHKSLRIICCQVLYVPPLAPYELPPEEELPKRRTNMDVKAMFPKQIELQGYDPVAFLDGKLRFREQSIHLIININQKVLMNCCGFVDTRPSYPAMLKATSSSTERNFIASPVKNICRNS